MHILNDLVWIDLQYFSCCLFKIKWKRFWFLKGEIISCRNNNIFFWFLHYFAGDGQATCSLWNNGKEMIWYHIYKIAFDEMNNGLKLIPKLTLEHVQLNPYSIRKVHLAIQVLSENVSCILINYYPDAAHGTAEFCKFMDMFFRLFKCT